MVIEAKIPFQSWVTLVPNRDLHLRTTDSSLVEYFGHSSRTLVFFSLLDTFPRLARNQYHTFTIFPSLAHLRSRLISALPVSSHYALTRFSLKLIKKIPSLNLACMGKSGTVPYDSSCNASSFMTKLSILGVNWVGLSCSTEGNLESVI